MCDPNKIDLTREEDESQGGIKGRCKVSKGESSFGSFRATLVLSILVGIAVPISMLGQFSEATKWKMFILIGLLSFASFWAIASISWIIIVLVVRKSKSKER